MAALKSALFYPLAHGRAIVRTMFWLVAGFLMIAGLACGGIFFLNGNPDALAAAIMFLAFGGVGLISAAFYDDIVAALRPDDVRRA